jgi:hypothetical protein
MKCACGQAEATLHPSMCQVWLTLTPLPTFLAPALAFNPLLGGRRIAPGSCKRRQNLNRTCVCCPYVSVPAPHRARFQACSSRCQPCRRRCDTSSRSLRHSPTVSQGAGAGCVPGEDRRAGRDWFRISTLQAPQAVCRHQLRICAVVCMRLYAHTSVQV